MLFLGSPLRRRQRRPIVVTSVTLNVADTNGTSTHVIAGSGFTGLRNADDVKIGTAGGGYTNVTSFTVNSDTQITFTAPAKSAGDYDLVVGGTTVLAGGFSYWNLGVPTGVTSAFDGAYTLPSSVGLWTQNAGSLLRNMVAADAGTSPSIVNTADPKFGHTSRLRWSADATWANLVGGGSATNSTILLDFSIEKVMTLYSASKWLGEQILSDNNFCSRVLLMCEPMTLRYHWYDSAHRMTEIAIPFVQAAAPTVTANGAAQTITRAAGDWLAEGFSTSAPVKVILANPGNSFTATPTNVTQTVLTFAPGTGIVNEGPSATSRGAFTVPSTGRIRAVLRRNASPGNTEISIDGGATWSTGTATGALYDLTTWACVGNYDNGAYLDRLSALGFYSGNALSNAECAKFYKWAAARRAA